MPLHKKYRSKHYWKIPHGEVQLGTRTWRLTIWYKGRSISIPLKPARRYS